ncbi:MAG: UDP-glucuronic acid decarboxylase family protein [Armatimonadota bacterium]
MDCVVISGGAGFLGSHLVDAFIARGLRVVVIDNLITGNRRNLAHLADDERLVFLEQDCAEPIHLEMPVQYVMHFGSPASPADYMRHPLETMFAGSYGTHRMLELARTHQARFLVASTSEVYGDPQIHPQPESYYGYVNTVGPRSPYDEAKRFGETLSMAYYRTYGVNTGIVRIFNTYGPRMRLNDGRAIPTFVYQALTGKPITISGDGSMTRSFCYVSDLVEGIQRLLMSDLHDPVNLGNPEEYPILEIAQRIIAATGSRSELTFIPLMQDDPKVRRPDITRARTLLGWEPTIPLDQGLERTITALREAVACYVTE